MGFSIWLISNPLWWIEISKNFPFLWKFEYGDSREWWLWTRSQILKIQNSGSNLAVQSFENCSIVVRICIHWVFGSLISNTLSNLRNSKWSKEISKNFQFLWTFVYRGFRGCWLRIYRQILKIQNGSSNMPAHNFENCFMYIKISWKFFYSGFLGRRFRIRYQYFEIRNGGTKFRKISNFHENLYMGFSRMLITNPLSDFEFWILKMAVLIWQWICSQRPKNRVKT